MVDKSYDYYKNSPRHRGGTGWGGRPRMSMPRSVYYLDDDSNDNNRAIGSASSTNSNYYSPYNFGGFRYPSSGRYYNPYYIGQINWRI